MEAFYEYMTVANVLLFVLFVFLTHQLVELYGLRDMPPGPGFPVLPVVGHALHFDFAAKDFTEASASLTKKYGRVLSLKLGGYRLAIASSPAAVHEVLVKKSGDFAGRRQSYSFRRATLGGKDIILGNYGSAWRLHRKLLITAMRQYLSDATLIQQTILQEAAGLLTSMKSHEGRPFDPEHIFTHAVANVICKITFGADYDMSNADMEKLLLLNQRFFERNEDIQTVLMLEFFPIMEYIPELPPNKRIFAIRDETFEIIRTLLNKRKKGFDPTKPVQDLLSGLLVETEKATEQGSEDLRTLLSEDYLLNTIEDMFLAGYETTSTSLRWAIAFLVNHPQYQTDIQRSLDEVIGRERIPNMEDRSKLPLIHATIMEVLRLGNILPQAIPHLTTRDTSLCGYRVPKDTVVIVDTQAVHLDPTCWDEPTVFNPYRHIDEDGKLISDRGNFYPFGAGRRVCAGEPLAKLELFFFLCSMLQKFTFVPVDEESMPSWKEGRNGGTRHPYPYKIRAMQRC